MGESERPAHADVSPPITSELNHILWQAANPPPFGPGQGNLNRDPDSEVWAGQGRRCRCRNSSDFDVMMMFNCIAIIISNGRPGSWRIGVVWILMSFTCSSSKKPPSKRSTAESYYFLFRLEIKLFAFFYQSKIAFVFK